MDDDARAKLEQFEPLLGAWSIEAIFPGAPPSDVRGALAFEWGPGQAFLIQRWEVPIPEAPDGVAIVAVDEAGGEPIQHYFDSRGVVRQYEMSVEAGVWSIRKLSPGFLQRFRGEFSTDGKTIEGAWEKAEENATWEHDFDLVYRKLD